MERKFCKKCKKRLTINLFGKNKSSRRDEDGGSGVGGFLQGLKSGFLNK